MAHASQGPSPALLARASKSDVGARCLLVASEATRTQRVAHRTPGRGVFLKRVFQDEGHLRQNEAVNIKNILEWCGPSWHCILGRRHGFTSIFLKWQDVILIGVREEKVLTQGLVTRGELWFLVWLPGHEAALPPEVWPNHQEETISTFVCTQRFMFPCIFSCVFL